MFYDFTEKKTHNKNIEKRADKTQSLRYDNITVNIFMGRSEMFKLITKSYKVGMYIRLSREDGDKQESESIGNQRKIIERYLKEQDLNIVDEYVDDGVSRNYI